MKRPVTVTVTDNGANSTSDSIPAHGEILAGIQMPSAFDSSNIVIQGSSDGTTFYDMYEKDGTTFIGITGATAQKFFPIDMSKTVAPLFYKLKIVSDQSANRTFQIVLVDMGV